ncbi:MAG TPA: helix-turn-helix transcriptional regulator [Rhodanobacter sp.]|nr:helix-turn-helix transcriptional regulator [Rhodanobacter sp.]
MTTSHDTAAEDRHLLGDFLRARRAALSPADVGQTISPGGRRRTPGLRREEVALLCGLSTTWYTWIEQGRDIQISAAAAARLADVLRLNLAERGYLLELAHRRDPSPAATAATGSVDPALDALLQTIAAPAYLLDGGWCVQARNAAAEQLFQRWFGSGESCLLRFVFLQPVARSFICQWEQRAQRLLAECRADLVQPANDNPLRERVAELLKESPDFARLWPQHAVLAREGGERAFQHPQRGLLRYRQTTLLPATQMHCKVVMLVPIAP